MTAYCDSMYKLIVSCGNYHHSLHFTPEKTRVLKKGLTEMGSRLAALGPLPRGREGYFKESLAGLMASVDEALKKISSHS